MIKSALNLIFLASKLHKFACLLEAVLLLSKCSSDTKISSSDIKLETENEDEISQEDAPAFLSQNVYHPRLALKNGIANWLPEFYQSRKGRLGTDQQIATGCNCTVVMPIIPIIPSANTCMTLTSTSTTITTTANLMPVPEVNTTQLQLFADVCSTVTSVPAPIMNSLVSAAKVTNDSLPNPVAAAVTNLAIPTTIPISSIPGPIMSINTTDVIEDCAEDKGNMSEPLEDDAAIENDLEQQQLDESAEKRKSLEIPLLVDEEL
ncbi:conserved hypothetical protein [Culex quinquefasciatus]|uniref:Uncharacterized protein n=1 Tax=Culex quinquefasciatus TaxID=7176 RepID=B0XL04_CULQU|nr:conserved hypothetical protein [Culex quinquefasciatus]|eukprot:XP_001870326.1 conserved hypothetical protein [Culex quinquefasciatus]